MSATIRESSRDYGRAINAPLGFRPLPDFLVVRGRPWSGIMER